jgi:hypothetical protein
MLCKKGNQVSVLNSGSGFYIGTFDKDGPYCRISEYYKRKESALRALDLKEFSIRKCVEVDFCSNGNCFK